MPEMAASHPCQTPTRQSAGGANLLLLSLALPFHVRKLAAYGGGAALGQETALGLGGQLWDWGQLWAW